MARIVVAGTENASGNNPTTVAVVDASNPTAPVVTPLSPGIGTTGARVAIDGALLAVGAVLNSTVKLFDVTKPAMPAATATVTTPLAGGIGALAVRGTLVAAAEWTSLSGARVSLIDASLATPAVVSTAATPFIGNTIPDPMNPMSLPAITSVAFLSDTKVVASAPTSGQISLIDFSNRSMPTVTNKNTTFAGIGSADADADAQLIAAGDGGGGQVRRFDATVANPLTVNTQLGGIGSLSLSAPRAIAGSPNSFNVALVDFSVPGFTSFGAQLNGGATAAMRGTFIALGSILGPFGSSNGRIQFFDATATGAPLGHADVSLASISTIGIGETTDVTASPTALDFGVVAATASATLSVTVKNAGTVVRNLTGATIAGATGSGTFAFVPPPPSVPIALAAGVGTATITLRYTGGAALGPASATLKLTTDDPAAASIDVSLAGRVGAAVAVFSPASLTFGSLAVCKPPLDRTTVLSNTGSLPLSVTGITVAGDPRLTLVAPAPAPTIAAPLVISPGGTASLTARFAPAGMPGAIPAASLTIASNAAGAPSVPITGTAVTSPPSIAVSANALAFGTIPVSSSVALLLRLSNGSACMNLTATLSLTAAPFSVETSSGPGFTMTGALTATVSVMPGASTGFAIAFSPAAAGAFTDTLTITSNDPAQGTLTIPLTGAAVVAPPTALELVLDRSGSMSDTVPGGTKMSSLHDTVGLFAQIVPFGNGDEVGVVAFDTTASVITPRATWTAARQSIVTAAVNALQPLRSTSIGAGLDSGRAELGGTTLPRKVALVFTDGMENTPPMIAQSLPAITAAGIEAYAVGLGRPAEISTAALSQLAVDSRGKFFSTDDALVLRKQFLQVLADSFRQNVAADPVSTLRPGRPVSLAVDLTACERSVTFAASWDDPNSSVLATLATPQGSVLTPASSSGNRLVEYGLGPTYAWYRVRFAPIDPGSGQFMEPAPAGTWVLQVSAVNLAGASERVSMSALVESELTLKVDVKATDTASPIVISAALLDGSGPVSSAFVQARVTPPGASLAKASTRAVVAQALAADQHGGRPLRPVRLPKPATSTMAYSAGRYTKKLKPADDGVYQIEVIASGAACGGNFDRYAAYSVYVAPKVSGPSSGVIVTPTVPGAGIITITPTTAGGVPIGPGNAHLLQISVSGSGATSDAIDLGNGSYAFRVWWNPRAKKPTATIVIAGQRKTVSLAKSSRSGRRLAKKR